MMRKYVLRFVVAAALFVALLLPLSPGAHGADLGTERSVFEFLTTELGLNSAAACVVLANIEAESNFILKRLWQILQKLRATFLTMLESES